MNHALHGFMLLWCDECFHTNWQSLNQMSVWKTIVPMYIVPKYMVNKLLHQKKF